MANVDAPRGFIPAYHFTGGTIRFDEMRIASGYDTSIFTGDLVTQVADGTITQTVADTATPCGVFQGVYYTNAAGEQIFSKYWPANTVATNIRARVITDPWVVYLAQHDGTPSGYADMNANYDIVVGTGNTQTGVSAMEVQTSSAKSTTAHLRVVGIPSQPDNDPDAANATVYVRILEHLQLTATGIHS